MIQHVDSQSASEPQDASKVEALNFPFDPNDIAQTLLLHPKNRFLGSDPSARPDLWLNGLAGQDKVTTVMVFITGRVMILYSLVAFSGLLVLEEMVVLGLFFALGAMFFAWYYWGEYIIRRNLIEHGQVIPATLIKAYWKYGPKRDLLIITYTFHTVDGNPVTHSKAINGVFWLKGKKYTIQQNPVPICLRNFRIKSSWQDVVEVLTPGTPLLILCDKNHYRFL